MAIVRPIIKYEPLVWWKAMYREKNRKTIEKVQRLSAIRTTGVIKSTLQAVLEVLLNLQLLMLIIKSTATKGPSDQ